MAMAQYFRIHPDNPQPRLIHQAVEIIRDGGVIAYPTDSSYALGCHLDDRHALERIREIRKVDQAHDFSLVCRDLADIALYARVSNADYRLLKARTPGPYTFILPATREVPRRLQHPKKKTIGVRLPDHAITQAIIAELGEPLLSTTLIAPGEHEPMSDPEAIRDRYERRLDLVIDGGMCENGATSVLLVEDGHVTIVRHGLGDVAGLE